MSITINWDKEKVINFLKTKLNIGDKILTNLSNEEIDGEALSLCRKKEFDSLGIKVSNRKKIIENLEKCKKLMLTGNIQHNNLYKNINTENLNDLWNKLEDKLKQLKLGDKLKYIKYLIIKDSPPKKEKKDDLFIYFKKVLNIEETKISQILDSLEDLLSFKEEEFDEKCEEWELSNENIFKLNIIIELINKPIEKDNNQSTEETIKSNTPKKEDKIIIDQKIKENGEPALNSLELNIISQNNSLDDNYLLYSAIEAFKYETSQGEITVGLINPIEQFKKICDDFKINYENECTFIDYDQAKKIELSTFMLWGSKESLNQFFKYNKINNACKYFNENKEIKKKPGIYLCVNIQKKVGYLIIWPGNLSYQYSDIEEPNDTILLTLIRYGFSLSPNSIICLCKNEIDNFNFKGYDIFEDIGSSGFDTERSRIVIKVIKEKTFKLGKKEILMGSLKEELYNKKIIGAKINHNCLLLNEEKGGMINTMKKKINFIEFTQKHIYDFYFDNNFEIDFSFFYHLIKINRFLKENEKMCCYTEQGLKDIIKIRINKKVDEIFKSMKNELINDKYLENKVKCIYCKNNQNKNLELYICIKENRFIYFHEPCFKKHKPYDIMNYQKVSKDEYIISKRYSLYLEHKINILKKRGILKDIISSFFEKCEDRFQSLSLIGYYLGYNTVLKVDKEIILEEINNFKRKAVDYISNNLEQKKNLIGTELKKFENYKKLDESKKSSINKDIIKKWKETIKKNFDYEKNKIKKWIIIKSWEIITEEDNNKFTIFLSYDFIEVITKKNLINLYEIKPMKDSSEFCLSYSQDLGESKEIETYYPDENKGLIIYKNHDKFKIKFKKKNIEEFKGLYNYDIISGTLIVYREENNEKKFGIYYSNGNSKTFYCNDLFDNNNKLNKIMLVPCVRGYEKQSLLLFIDKEIQIIKIKDKTNYPKTINLSQQFHYEKFEDLQFIISLDFLLILKFDDKNDIWNGKIFSLCLEDDSLFEYITSISLNGVRKESQFSFVEIKEKKYLFSLFFIEDVIPLINYWEIDSQLSGISTNYQIRGRKQNISNAKIPFGNCIVNHFYHCFEKYPLLGALQYQFKNYQKNTLNISFFIDNYYCKKRENLKNYLNELRLICENRKKISFSDINFNFIDNYQQNFEIKDSSIGYLLIKFLEITPIQIAKIMSNEFKVMSDGENVEKKLYFESQKRTNLKKDPKINIIDYSKMINFCIKDSIFNYYELPVIVICCFGTQSIGKSTFLNELIVFLIP